jgi:hypothetical protein
MRIVTNQLASVSTANILERDGKLLLDLNAELSGAIAQRYGGLGIIFHVCAEETDFYRQLRDLRDAGLSEEFLNVLRAVRNAGIEYVDINADGDVVEGLPTFDW